MDPIHSLSFTAPASVVIDPLIQVMLSASVYVTIALSIDRCMAVLKPLQWSVFITRTKIKLVILGFSLWAVFINIPFFMENELVNVQTRFQNKTFLLPQETEYSATDFHNVAFLKYLVPITTMVIPIAAILISNLVIVYKVMSKKNEVESSRGADDKKQESLRLTYQVLFISALTLVSRIFHATTYIMLSNENTVYVTMCTFSCAIMAAITAFFIKVNAATNFICYCYFGKRFRQVLVSTFKCLECLRMDTGHKNRATRSGGTMTTAYNRTTASKYTAQSTIKHVNRPVYGNGSHVSSAAAETTITNTSGSNNDKTLNSIKVNKHNGKDGTQNNNAEISSQLKAQCNASPEDISKEKNISNGNRDMQEKEETEDKSTSHIVVSENDIYSETPSKENDGHIPGTNLTTEIPSADVNMLVQTEVQINASNSVDQATENDIRSYINQTIQQTHEMLSAEN